MHTVASHDVSSLYARYSPSVLARCKRLLKDQAAAEDATHEVFMKVIRHAGQAPAEQRVAPWLHRIATNHCLNVIRDTKRHAEPTETVPESVDDAFEQEMLDRDVAKRVLNSAPEDVRVPAELYHREGLEQQQVAERLGVSRRTVLYRLAAFSRHAMQVSELGS